MKVGEKAVLDVIREVGQAQHAVKVIKAWKHPDVKRKMGLGLDKSYPRQLAEAERYLVDSAFALSIVMNFIDRGPLGWWRRARVQRYIAAVDKVAAGRMRGLVNPGAAVEADGKGEVVRDPGGAGVQGAGAVPMQAGDEAGEER